MFGFLDKNPFYTRIPPFIHLGESICDCFYLEGHPIICKKIKLPGWPVFSCSSQITCPEMKEKLAGRESVIFDQ